MNYCSRCEGRYKYLDETGIELDCNCILENIDYKFVDIKGKEKENVEIDALVHGIIPKERIGDEFSLEYLKNRVKEIEETSGWEIKNFKEYEEVLYSIVSNLNLGKKLNESYLISAHNGFGKTTFVNTCQKICIVNGWRVVPYISLIELNEMYSKYINYLRGIILECYNEFGVGYKEYIGADLVFLYLSAVNFYDVELPMLKLILTERAKRFRPTVVTCEFAIRDYRIEMSEFMDREKKSSFLRQNERFWMDHLESNVFRSSFDRFKYVSCYRGRRKASRSGF